jgi:acetylornithine deacetylase/succinyl-diaminopimelate desuccinylase-like protein
MRLPLAGILLVALAQPPAAPQPSEAEAVYADLAVGLLREYLRLDTTVPPGNERRGADFYQRILEREGIPVELDEFEPGRANLLATLAGDGSRRPLILMNHMDVVPADPARWSVPPFSGELKDGLIWGRGAQDMKAEGILQLLALLRLKREGIPLQRDVLFLATADEESDFKGALRALEAGRWRERLERAEYLITEGGENLLGAEGAEYFAIETGQKGVLWLTLRTTGTPGHGSLPIDDSAPNRLVRALERVRQHRTPMRALPSVARFFRDQAPRADASRAGWYADIARALEDPAAAAALYDDRSVSSLLRNTISITVVRAGYKTNVIPGTAEAELDVRLLPGEDPEAFLAELRRVIDDPSVEIGRRPEFRAAPESPVDTELFRAIERTLTRHFPGVPVTTRMATGATESVLFRPLGVTCYGFTPLLTTAREVASAHGDDERVGEATLRRSTGVFYEVVLELARSAIAQNPIPLDPGTWWVYREAYTERIGALDSIEEDTTRFQVTGSRARPFISQSGGADPAPGPVERGEGWIRLGPWTGEEALPVPLVPGRRGPTLPGAAAGWEVEGDEEVQVPAGTFRTRRCALRTRQIEAVLWIAPGVGVVRETQGVPGLRPEIERVLLKWSGAASR